MQKLLCPFAMSKAASRNPSKTCSTSASKVTADTPPSRNEIAQELSYVSKTMPASKIGPDHAQGSVHDNAGRLPKNAGLARHPAY